MQCLSVSGVKISHMKRLWREGGLHCSRLPVESDSMSDDCVFLLRRCHQHWSLKQFEGLRLLTVSLLSISMANVQHCSFWAGLTTLGWVAASEQSQMTHWCSNHCPGISWRLGHASYWNDSQCAYCAGCVGKVNIATVWLLLYLCYFCDFKNFTLLWTPTADATSDFIPVLSSNIHHKQ